MLIDLRHGERKGCSWSAKPGAGMHKGEERSGPGPLQKDFGALTEVPWLRLHAWCTIFRSRGMCTIEQVNSI